MQAGRLMLLILRPFLLGIITLWTDLTEPFSPVQIRHGGISVNFRKFCRRRATVRFAKKSSGIFAVAQNCICRWLLMRYALSQSVAACAALVYIVHNQLNNQYILEVQVGGETVGFVSSEQVFENASDDVQNRINTAKSVMEASGNTTTDDQWSIEPSYTLTVGTQTMTEGEVANAILSTTSAEVTEGTAVYVDGNLQFNSQ